MSWDEITIGLYGFGAGLALAFLLWVYAWWQQRGKRRELKKLKEHLNTQMEITAEGANKLKVELSELQQQNENLRVSVRAWQQKPGREEARMLQVYDRAVHKLLANTPGFSMAWEAALKEAESEVQDADKGLIAFAKRLVLPAETSSKPAPPSEED